MSAVDTACALADALAYAAQGLHVHPFHNLRPDGSCTCGKPDCVSPGKHPWSEHGKNDATTGPETIRSLFECRPGAQVGVNCGASGVVVLDVDVHGETDGREAWAELAAEYPALDAAPMAETPHDGWHAFYRANGRRIGSPTTAPLGAGIDVKGEGGSVILPSSSSPARDWVPGHELDAVPMAELPSAVAERLVYAKSKPKAAKAADVETIPEGGRNDALTSLAGTMRRRGMSVAEIVGALKVVNSRRCRPPLAEREVRQIAESIARKEPAAAVAEPAPLVLEAAHADVLARAWRGSYRWSQHEGAWRQWTGKVWRKSSESVVVNAAQKALRAHYGNELAKQQSPEADKRLRELHRLTCRHASILGGLAFLKGEPGFHTDFEAWDADPYILNCADGILDLKTQALHPHDPAELCTKVTTWSFAGESTGAWERHLRRCLPDDDIRRQVQRDLGRALVGTDLEESLPIWYGIGANGKSTTARTILQGVAEYGKQSVKDLLVASKFERHTTDLADLAGARIVIAEEVEDGKRLDEATVKNLTGGSRKKARFMRGDNFEFEQTFSIFELVNHRPVVTGTDTGIWRRLRLVPWTESIPFADQRPQDEMVAELMADGPWMLRWMVAGLADWQADHHWIAEPVQAATEAYRAEQDILAGFLSRKCVLNPHATVSVDKLHEAYVIDLMESGDEGMEPLTKVAFGKRLKSRNLTQGRDASRTRRMWLGIALRTSPDKNSVSVP